MRRPFSPVLPEQAEPRRSTRTRTAHAGDLTRREALRRGAAALVLACAALVSAGPAATQAQPQPAAAIRGSPPRPDKVQARAAAETELMRDLLGWASRLSHLPAPERPPTVKALSANALARRVCPAQPEHCRSLVAVYDTDTQEVLHLDSLDLQDPTDQSYIVHEFVHHLQHLRQGEDLFAGCPKVLAAEAQAYAVQNRYLERFKQWRRVGEILRFTHCPTAQAEPEVRPGEPSALTSRSPVGP